MMVKVGEHEYRTNTWVYGDPNEWYESIISWLNYRLQPTDVILGVTLFDFHIRHPDLISDISIIHEDLIETHICDLFVAPVLLPLRHPKTVWGGKGNQNNCKVDKRRSIWNMGVWTSTNAFFGGVFKIDLKDFGGSDSVCPWRQYEHWKSVPPRMRMTCRHAVVVWYADDADEEKFALRRSKRRCK